MRYVMWKRRAAIVQFKNRELEEALGLPADVQIIDAKRSFGTQCIELVLSGKGCPEVPDGNVLPRVKIESLKSEASHDAV